MMLPVTMPNTINTEQHQYRKMKPCKKQPMDNIRVPGPNDVICGRGGGSIHTEANIRYRKLVKAHQRQYISYETRHMKTLLTHELVKKWRQQTPPGRFLKKNDKTGLWFEVSNNDARRKTAQLFREGAKEVRKDLKESKKMTDQDIPKSNIDKDTSLVLAKSTDSVTEDEPKEYILPQAVTPDTRKETRIPPLCESKPPMAPLNARSDSGLLSDLRDIARPLKNRKPTNSGSSNTKTFPYSKPKTSIEMLESFFEDILDDSPFDFSGEPFPI